MATPVIMPRQGQSVESCIISNWAKKVGDSVSTGDILFTYETDKATFDEEAKTEGTLLAIFFNEGDDVPCLTNVCVIGAPGENFEQFDPNQNSNPPVPEVKTQPASVKSGAPKSNANPVIMPRQGQSVESCIISKWNKKVGDKVSVGDVLFTYETDKATFDEESKFEGTLLAIFFVEGDDVPCLTNVCVIGQPGEGFEEFDPRGQVQQSAPEVKKEPTHEIKEMPEQQAANTDGRLKISPRAKNLAEKSGADPKYAIGTGPYGRITENDIRDLIAKGPIATYAANGYAAGVNGSGLGGRISVNDLGNAVQTVQANIPTESTAEFEDVKLPNIRKVIAKSMHQSLSTMAQLTLNSSFDMTNINNYRKQLKENRERLSLENITINDIILYAVSRTILAHKDCNAHYLDDKMRYFKNVNIGIAVDTPRGLLVPTLMNANLKSLNDISKEAKKLAADSQAGTLNPDLTKNGTFTVTNLGTLGVESFTPVINPPQTCILGVNTITQRVREENGQLKAYPAMSLSLTFDHRALDGAPAARFLQELVKNLESFTLLLAR